MKQVKPCTMPLVLYPGRLCDVYSEINQHSPIGVAIFGNNYYSFCDGSPISGGWYWIRIYIVSVIVSNLVTIIKLHATINVSRLT